jgi:BirA family biotin operon repressor/biotin-[acetyl-CoA-carboxylase] ligase
LIEVASQGDQSYAVIGVGLNIQLPASNQLRTPAAALSEFWQGVSAPSALERVVKPLLIALKDFEANAFSPLQERFNARDALRGLNVTTSDGLEGLCAGVDEQGALQIDTPEGRVGVSSAEVSVRPK